MKLQRGQSLFELVVAIAISALIIVAMVSLATNSIKNSNYSKNKALASSYAQEATEWLRGQRDSNVEDFFNTYAIAYNNWCLPTLSFNKLTDNPVHCTDKISGTVFNRWVTFIPSASNVIEADVVITWTDSGGLHEVKSNTNFSDWRQR